MFEPGKAGRFGDDMRDHVAVQDGPELSNGFGSLYANRPGFEYWKTQVDAIADAEGLTPKENPTPSERDTWIKQFNEGKTPAQAWRAVPYKRRWV